MPKLNSPAFIDPIYNGAADPMIIKNEQTGKFFMFYTQRRASCFYDIDSVAYCYGSQIGVAEAQDKGAYWLYRGTLDLNFEFGHNTFWAPEIIWDEKSGLYHMYVSYIVGIQSNWRGNSSILHYTSPDLFNWKKEGKIEVGSDKIIDACLFKLPNGNYRMWYKDKKDGAHTYYADSEDLYNWQYKGQATFDNAQEGPNVFEFGNKYWLIADEWNGLAVYYSDDLTVFTRQDGERLLTGNGTRKKDTGIGRHADVIVNGGRAYIVYFVHYNDDGRIEDKENHPPTVVHIAELKIKDGKLVCDRNEEIDIELK